LASLRRWRAASRAACLSYGVRPMDILMLALGLGFFGLAVAYTTACDRL
jgi:hypothetical protein